MKISLIVAMGKNRVIGRGGQLPWKVASEHRHYRQTIAGYPLILGRKNYESGPHRFKGFDICVLTRQLNYKIPGQTVVQNIEAAINWAIDLGPEEVFVLGGADIYGLALSYAHRLYLSILESSPEGDVYFPEHEDYAWDQLETRSYPVAKDTPIAWNFYLLEKRPSLKVVE